MPGAQGPDCFRAPCTCPARSAPCSHRSLRQWPHVSGGKQTFRRWLGIRHSVLCRALGRWSIGLGLPSRWRYEFPGGSFHIYLFVRSWFSLLFFAVCGCLFKKHIHDSKNCVNYFLSCFTFFGAIFVEILLSLNNINIIREVLSVIHLVMHLFPKVHHGKGVL